MIVDVPFRDDVILVVDTNLGLEHARRLGEDGYETYYAVVHANPYPKLEDEICGYGFPEIKKIWDWGEGLDEGAGVIVFIDSGFGGFADWLRSKGYYVFGADSVSERLELDRVYVRNVLSRLGVDVPPGDVVKGINGVVQLLEQTGEFRFVKVSRFRGGVETFGTDDPKEAEMKLRQGGFSIIGDDVWFVLEKMLTGVEIGVDALFNGTEFLSPVFETIELRGSGNITKPVEIDDSLWHDTLMKLEPYLMKNGYHGFFCLEGFYDGSRLYVTDVTPRFPFICSYAYPKILGNFSEVVISVAKGEDIRPRPMGKYSAQIGVYTDMPDRWGVIRYRDNDPEWIAYRRVIKKDDKIWFVPGDYVVAVGVSAESTYTSAIRRATRRARKVSFPSSYYMGYEFLNYIDVIVDKLASYGYEW